MKKVFIKTYGCQMNAYDSGRLLDLLQKQAGYHPSDHPEDADLLVVNTCSVREKAQEKLFSELGRWRQLKEQRPGLLIAVGGCVGSQEGAALQRRAPQVDIVFGPQTLHRLPALIAQQGSTRGCVDVRFPAIEKFDHLPAPGSKGPTAFVSIMEGCSKYCSFCVVPYTRGEEVSRPLTDIVTEVQLLSQQGVREVTLLGQNVNAWQEPGDEYGDLSLLLRHLATIEGIDRLRFTTSHPREFSADLIRCFGDLPALAPAVHLPVQSGSDVVLMRMKRGYTRLQYRQIIASLRSIRPDISISSDFIVGFPGERQTDFEQTLSLIEETGFDHSYSFLYSPRPGTLAAEWSDDTPLALKKQRLQQLQNLLYRQQSDIGQSFVGQQQKILVEGISRRQKNHLCGRNAHNWMVNFPATEHLIGHFVTVEIEGLEKNSLRGKLLTDRAISPEFAAHA